MKKSKIKHYDETNYKKSPHYKKHVRCRRREKFRHFIVLPTVLWCIAFLAISVLLLFASYLLQERSAWLSSVFVSVGCGVVTGVILYFLANLRNGKRISLENEWEDLRQVQNSLSAVLEPLISKNMMELAGHPIDVLGTCRIIEEKLDELTQTLYIVSGGFLEDVEKDKNGYGRLYNAVEKLIEQSEIQEMQGRSAEWLSSVFEILKPFERELEKKIKTVNDQIVFLNKSIV